MALEPFYTRFVSGVMMLQSRSSGSQSVLIRPITLGEYRESGYDPRMDAYEAIVTRRSIRKYQDRPISDEVVRQILEAAMQAPSAVNKQPWHFVVVDDRKLLGEIPAIHPNARMTERAPCAIVVCGDATLAHGPGYLPQDCAAATENILLAAHALGVGSVWCGIYSREEREVGIRSLLGIPDGVVPFSLVVLGYPAEEPRQPERYRAERVHRNGW